MPRGSWIEEADALLAKIAERNSIGESDEDLRRASAAVAWAVDLYHISTCLGEQPFRSIAVELSKTTHGNLLASNESCAAKNYLSQFWVGALLAQGKLNPEMLAFDAPGRPKPDYIVQCSAVRFAVEVKRPSNGDAAIRLVGDAGDQIRRYDRPGIIVVDATDCMTSDPFQVTSNPQGVVPTVRSDLEQFHQQLVRHVETYSRSNKFHQVAMLISFARYWPWIRGEALQRAAGINFRASATRYRWGHQVTGLTRRVQDGILRGVEQLTGNPPRYSYF